MSLLNKAGYTCCLLAAAALASANLAIAKQSACKPEVRAAVSSTEDPAREASRLLSEIRADSAVVQDQAELLRRESTDTTRSFESHADALMTIRDKVNEMGSKLCRLEAMRANLLPWQQVALDRAETTVREMANSTRQAIDYLNENQSRFFVQTYRDYLAGLDAESTRLARAIGKFEQLAKLRKREQRLDKELGYQAGG
jgi:chromosome segregation ATPase